MAGYNRIIMVGNLTRDPDLKQLPSGGTVCRLSIASNRQFKNRQSGALVQEVCYVDVDVWGPQAETAKQYLQKGRPVLIEGRLKLDSWKEADGQSKSKHSIVADRVVFLGSNQAAESGMDLDDTSAGDVQPVKKMRSDEPRAPRAPKPAVSGANDGVTFKDEPPFADDLPF